MSFVSYGFRFYHFRSNYAVLVFYYSNQSCLCCYCLNNLTNLNLLYAQGLWLLWPSIISFCTSIAVVLHTYLYVLVDLYISPALYDFVLYTFDVLITLFCCIIYVLAALRSGYLAFVALHN